VDNLPLPNFINGSVLWHNWLRHRATSGKVAGSIPDGVIEIFHWPNRCDRIMAVGSTWSVTEMSTRGLSYSVKLAVCRDDNLTTFMCHLSRILGVSTSGTTEPVQGCNWILVFNFQEWYPLAEAAICQRQRHEYTICAHEWDTSFTNPCQYIVV
jgi:hypothetical protein